MMAHFDVRLDFESPHEYRSRFLIQLTRLIARQGSGF